MSEESSRASEGSLSGAPKQPTPKPGWAALRSEMIKH